MPANRIILTGFMGSGKSTAGPLVAEQIGYRFVDLDELVEAAAGRSAAEFFQERGESLFRALETAVLTQALVEEQVVIATGGGALTSEGTLGLAREGGIVVYLRVSPSTLVGRLESSEHRPLLKDDRGRLLRGQRLHDRVEAILSRRERFYEQADAMIDADDMTPPDVASAVVRVALERGLETAGPRN